jgi:hypothetical protein
LFEPSELVDERGLVSAEVGGGGFDGGEGHGGLEAAKPVPDLEAVLDRMADVGGMSSLRLVIISGRLCTPGGRAGMWWRRAAAITHRQP